MSNKSLFPKLSAKSRNIIYGLVLLFVAVANWIIFFIGRDLITMAVATVLSVLSLILFGRAAGWV